MTRRPLPHATVSVYGAGQLGTGVARLLAACPRYQVRGPFGRGERAEALESGSDVVVIATTTLLRNVIDDVARAVSAGSNVLVSAEEAAFPFVVDEEAAGRVDRLAVERGVSVAGAGVNPGLIFDSLVLTLLGTVPAGCDIRVRRIVDVSGFGPTVLRRIGIGFDTARFMEAVAEERILGHAGFPQSMNIVADAIGVTIDSVDRQLAPVIAESPIDIPGRFRVEAGESAGVDQTYTAIVGGRPWYTAHFLGHVDLPANSLEAIDEIHFSFDGSPYQTVRLEPGIGAQVGSQQITANSIDRIIAARPGWVTLAELPPAFPPPR